MFYNIKNELTKYLETAFEKLGLDKADVMVSYSNKPDVADYQCNSAFTLAKKLGKNPVLVANEIVEQLGNMNGDFVASVCPPAFINFKMTNSSP